LLPQQQNRYSAFFGAACTWQKYFSACKRENRSLLADDLCAAAGRNPYVKKGFALFVSLNKRSPQCGERLL